MMACPVTVKSAAARFLNHPSPESTRRLSFSSSPGLVHRRQDSSSPRLWADVARAARPAGARGKEVMFAGPSPQATLCWRHTVNSLNNLGG